jgi:hypothetical protein|tara:strand:+ start:3493 stop:3699 length:207 start_codon:yes stop_codon:yes gene_type:complete
VITLLIHRIKWVEGNFFMNKKKKKKKEPEKSIFHTKSSAGKGDKPRVGVSYEEWGKKWEKIFGKKEKK